MELEVRAGGPGAQGTRGESEGEARRGGAREEGGEGALGARGRRGGITTSRIPLHFGTMDLGQWKKG